MSIELDTNDLTILSRLNENGRATYSELASELHLTVPTIKSRIDKLVKIGVIARIGIYLNPHSLTNDSSALIALQVDKEVKSEFLDFIISLEEVKEVYEALDELNILIITQIQPLNMHQLFFDNLKSHSHVKRAKLNILVKEVLSNPHRIPKQNTLLNIRCEYCGKQITDSYESAKFDGVRHYFCCSSCLKNYSKWRGSLQH
ncbi:MAG: winged helix-turn-helix transcriptional regulator [Candidatus Hodarchaeales archaeon]|jgi:DNA-binding Lrp family transcriptional regulator